MAENITYGEALDRLRHTKAPRVTLDQVKASVAATEFVVRPPLTICIATLQNGFTVIGHSAAASPENFDEAVGRSLALEQCHRQIWPLLGYELRERLHQLGRAKQDGRGEAVG